MSRAATTRLKVNPPLGTMPVLQFCMLNQLKINESYQRSLEVSTSQTLIRRIAQFWNWDLCQPLVVARRADGELYVVDGQHRLAAARLRTDIPQLPCVIASYANAADEAASFVALNQQRRPLGAMDLFRAALAAEDDHAVAIMAAMSRAGLTFAPHSNFTAWNPGMVYNIGGIQASMRAHGAEITERALKILAEAFKGQILRQAGSVFGGIAQLIGTDRATDYGAIVAYLSRTGQNEFRRAVLLHRSKNPNAKYATAAAAVIREGISQRLGAEPRPSPKHPEFTAMPPAPRHDPFSDEEPMRWCDQCERRVTDERFAACASPFCSLRRADEKRVPA